MIKKSHGILELKMDIIRKLAKFKYPNFVSNSTKSYNVLASY